MKLTVELATVMMEEMAAASAADEGGLAAAMEKAKPLQANVVDLSEMDLKEGGADVKVVVAWMRSNPAGLTRLKVDYGKVAAEGVEALHVLVVETQTLVDLDVMEKGAADLNVLELNGTEAVKSVDLSKRGLGPLSVAIIGACVKGNAVLEILE